MGTSSFFFRAERAIARIYRIQNDAKTEILDVSKRLTNRINDDSVYKTSAYATWT